MANEASRAAGKPSKHDCAGRLVLRGPVQFAVPFGIAQHDVAFLGPIDISKRWIIARKLQSEIFTAGGKTVNPEKGEVLVSLNVCGEEHATALYKRIKQLAAGGRERGICHCPRNDYHGRSYRGEDACSGLVGHAQHFQVTLRRRDLAGISCCNLQHGYACGKLRGWRGAEGQRQIQYKEGDTRSHFQSRSHFQNCSALALPFMASATNTSQLDAATLGESLIWCGISREAYRRPFEAT